MRRLANIGILAKILLAGMPLVVVLIAFWGYSITPMSQLAKSIVAVKGAWNEGAVAAANEKEVLTIRSDVGKFLATGSEQHLKAAMERAQRLGGSLRRHGDAVTEAASRALLTEAVKALDD